MKTITYIFFISLFIAASAMAAPAKEQRCQVQGLGSMSDVGGDGSPVDIVSLKCGTKSLSALVFSQSQTMLFSLAKKQGKTIGVAFEKIDKKRLAVGEINF